MMCDSCHAQPATCHIVNIVDGVQHARDLCQECFDASSVAAAEALSANTDATCRYCGGRPCIGAMDVLAAIVGTHQRTFMCLSCSTEFQIFVQHELQQLPSNLSGTAQAEAMQKLHDKADEHMFHWVSLRDA